MMLLATVVISLSVVIYTGCFVGAANLNNSAGHAQLESKLYAEIFSGYNRHFRPANQTVISIAMSLASVVEVNEQEGHVTTTFIPKMMWTDTRLVWNRTEKSPYQHVDHLQVPDSLIWLPDLEVLNRFKDMVHDTAMEPLVWLHSTGLVYYVPRRTFHTPCTFDFSKFPYDEQVCKIVLGSWAYLRNEVDFTLMDNGTDVDFYNMHNEFSLKNLTIERKESTYGEGFAPFVELVMTLTLQRRYHFFYYMYLMPANVILFAFPLIHTLPADSPCKFISLGTVFISSILMWNTLAGFLPSYESSPPMILKLYLACFLCSMASSLGSCITLSICNTNERTKRVPLIFRKLMRFKAKLCCENTTPAASFDYQLLQLNRAVENESHEGQRSEQEMSAAGNGVSDDSQQVDGSNRDSTSAVTQVLQQLVSELQLTRHREQVRLEWVKLAQLLDFLFGFAFTIAAFSVISLIHRNIRS